MYTKICKDCIALFKEIESMNYCMARNKYVNEDDEQCEFGSRLVMNDG